MDASLIDLLDRGLAGAGPVVVLTGAGISAESGIPTFRGEDGYWTVGSAHYHPEDMATNAAFGRMPEEVWRWYLYRRSVCRAAEPNPAHRALVALEEALGDRFLLITQNVDGLHLRAGSSAARTYQIHGNIDFLRCGDEPSSLRPIPLAIGDAWTKDAPFTEEARALLSCCDGGRLARPHVLWFDEYYDEALFHWQSSLRAAGEASLLIVIGTSGSTNLPMQVGSIVARRGAPMIVINQDPSPFSRFAEESGAGWFARGRAGDHLPPMVEHLLDARVTPTYAKSTYLFGRGLGAVILIAFVSWHVQQAGLVGDHGILPASDLLELYRQRGLGFSDLPTLAWWLGADGGSLSAMCFVGELAAALLMFGVLPGPMALASAAFYLSLQVLGGPFMAFQWDLLVIETALLAALVLPWRLWHSPRALIEPPPFARWAIYALAFRLMFLSGVVKLSSGDAAWAELRALDYHYWTQPLPNPLAWLVHQLPSGFHTVSTVGVFVAELVLPFGIVLALLATAVAGALHVFAKRGSAAAVPRAVSARALRMTGLGTMGLMLVIGLTGNYGFFNALTAVIALPLLDDALVDRLTPERLRARLARASRRMHVGHRVVRLAQCSLLLFTYWLGALALLMGLGAGPSLPDALHEDVQAAQPYRIANGYGLFAVMTRVRREIRVEGSLDGVEWREYRFAHKPGDPAEVPGVSAPHMPRLDWQMWFAALGSYRHNPWLGRFMRRLLEAEPSVLALLEEDPFDGERPRFVRATLWDYRFSDMDGLRERGVWWEVEELGPYSPTIGRR